MTAIHTALQSVVKYFNKPRSSHVDDSRISSLQYKGVFGTLIACAILSGLTNWYSKIDCVKPDFNNMEKKLVEEWCYANSTFALMDEKGEFNLGNPHSDPSNKVEHFYYYQWVTLALVLQAACFQVPRMIWKCAEHGSLRKIVDYLKDLEFANENEYQEKVEKTAKYFLDADRRRSNRNYFNFFAFSQFLYFVIILLQIAFTDAFLKNHFINLGFLWLQNSPTWNVVFPKLVKCNFISRGFAGSEQKGDVLCVLSMNVLFERLYLLIWFLFVIALCAAIFQVVFVGVCILSSEFLIDTNARPEVPLDLSDWLLLKFLRQSLDSVIYEAFVREISTKGPVTRV